MSATQTTTYGREQSRLFLPSREALATLKLQANGGKEVTTNGETEPQVEGWSPVTLQLCVSI
jgi:hypothetical protein